MKKLLTLIATLIMCNAYGDTNAVVYLSDGNIHDAQQCTSGGNITKAADPTKDDYRFLGWRQATDAEFLAINGSTYSPNTATRGTINWTTTFSYGLVTGEWRCSVEAGQCTSGGYGKNHINCTKSSNPSLTGGCGSTYDVNCDNAVSNAGSCWCKMTNLAGKDTTSLDWVFVATVSKMSDCASACSSACANFLKGEIELRRSVFGMN